MPTKDKNPEKGEDDTQDERILGSAGRAEEWGMTLAYTVTVLGFDRSLRSPHWKARRRLTAMAPRNRPALRGMHVTRRSSLMPR